MAGFFSMGGCVFLVTAAAIEHNTSQLAENDKSCQVDQNIDTLLLLIFLE